MVLEDFQSGRPGWVSLSIGNMKTSAARPRAGRIQNYSPKRGKSFSRERCGQRIKTQNRLGPEGIQS